MPAHETTLEAMFLGPSDAPIRPSQYRPVLKPMTPVDLEKWLTPDKWLALTQPSNDAAKLDAIIAEQRKMGRQLRLITNLLVGALDDRDEDDVQ
ncbi:hypothetical protein BH686_07120 [Rhodococcus erythropolis]|uniref:hypothetical protein n=1 Tax=Rhodococcus erythropolis TaxID=1833 RepID=UPI000A0625FF|nr:hypothetical protein [Rhodococcus erythropolis]ORI19937.1 hypothetical protein BH686_07120 [Rhodococcus erythropolis]